jgi:hypothetical protein
MIGSSPNNGIVTLNVASNIVALFNNQALNDSDNTSDNTGSSPKNNTVSPNIDCDLRTSLIKPGVEADKSRYVLSGSSPNSTHVSPNTNEYLSYLVICQMFYWVNEATCIVVSSPKQR